MKGSVVSKALLPDLIPVVCHTCLQLHSIRACYPSFNSCLCSLPHLDVRNPNQTTILQTDVITPHDPKACTGQVPLILLAFPPHPDICMNDVPCIFDWVYSILCWILWTLHNKLRVFAVSQDSMLDLVHQLWACACDIHPKRTRLELKNETAFPKDECDCNAPFT